MIRHVDISEISDGRFYGHDDKVKVGCGDCAGCSACCHGMGDTILLDPLDVVRLEEACRADFSSLVNTRIRLTVVDGCILPCLNLAGEGEGCTFLNEKGRCSIHPLRPGICRIFPLGRYYHDGEFSYFLQVGECEKGGTEEVKVRDWVDTPQIKRYDMYITDWHYFVKEVGLLMPSLEEGTQNQLSLYVLKLFFNKPYDGKRDFYEQFYERLEEDREVLEDVRG